MIEEKLDSEETAQKQELLQREIIDKNLDKNAFINYCLRKKEDGDDLNNWTFQELKDLVSDFQNSKSAKPGEKKEEENEVRVETVEKIEKFDVITIYNSFRAMLRGSRNLKKKYSVVNWKKLP